MQFLLGDEFYTHLEYVCVRINIYRFFEVILYFDRHLHKKKLPFASQLREFVCLFT